MTQSYPKKQTIIQCHSSGTATWLVGEADKAWQEFLVFYTISFFSSKYLTFKLQITKMLWFTRFRFKVVQLLYFSNSINEADWQHSAFGYWTVWVSSHTSFMLMLNNGAPQGCVFSPLLFMLYIHDCSAKHQENLFLWVMWMTPPS